MTKLTRYYPISGANFSDFSVDYPGVSLAGETIVFKGTSQPDFVYLSGNFTFDFTDSGTSQITPLIAGFDKVYLAGRRADYTVTLQGETLLLSGTNRPTVSMPRGDSVVFEDGQVDTNAWIDALASGAAAPTTDPSVTATGGVDAMATLALGEATPSARMIAFVLGSEGGVFARVQPGMRLEIKGSSGVDKVYVKKGSTVDFTDSSTGDDVAYLTGRWSDYTITSTAESVVVEFARGTELLRAAGSDLIVFADGMVNLSALKGLLDASPNKALSIGDLGNAWDPNTRTPGVNSPPTAVSLSRAVTALGEDTDTSSRRKLGDITITDDGAGANVVTLSGVDAPFFDLVDLELYLKAGVKLDFEGLPSLQFTINVADAGLPDSLPILRPQTITITDINDTPVALRSSTLVSAGVVAEDQALDLASSPTLGSLLMDRFQDADQTGQLIGAVVVNNLATAAQGLWQYYARTSAQWISFPDGLSDHNALFLAADSKLRFLPATNFAGAPGQLSLRLSDNSFTAPAEGTLVDTTNRSSTSNWTDRLLNMCTLVTARPDASTATVELESKSGAFREGATLSANIRDALDVDGSIRSTEYQWQLNSGNGWVDLNTPNGHSPTLVVPTQQGWGGQKVRARVRVTDSTGDFTDFFAGTSTGVLIQATQHAPKRKDDSTEAIDLYLVRGLDDLTFNMADWFDDADGSPLTFSAQTLPSGLTLTSGGVLQGRSNTTQSSAVVINVTDGITTLSQGLNLHVVDAPVLTVKNPVLNRQVDKVTITAHYAFTTGSVFKLLGPDGLEIHRHRFVSAEAGSTYSMTVNVSELTANMDGRESIALKALYTPAGAQASSLTSPTLELLLDRIAPQMILPTKFTLAEDSLEVEGLVSLNDPKNDEIWSLAPTGDFALFEIDAATGQLKLKSNLDFETDRHPNHLFNLRLVVTDSAGNRTDQAIAVELQDRNDAPQARRVSLNATQGSPLILKTDDFFKDDDGQALTIVQILSLPTTGRLMLSTAEVQATQRISVADIEAGRLRFETDPDAVNASSAQFGFMVEDAGDPKLGPNRSTAPGQITLQIRTDNDAPASVDAAVFLPRQNEDESVVMAALDLIRKMGAYDGQTPAAQLNLVVQSVTSGGQLAKRINGQWQVLGLGDTVLGTESLRWTPPPNQEGELVAFAVRLADPQGMQSTPIQVMAKLAPVNDAPELGEFQPWLKLHQGETISLFGRDLFAHVASNDAEVGNLGFIVNTEGQLRVEIRKANTNAWTRIQTNSTLIESSDELRISASNTATLGSQMALRLELRDMGNLRSAPRTLGVTVLPEQSALDLNGAPAESDLWQTVTPSQWQGGVSLAADAIAPASQIGARTLKISMEGISAGDQLLWGALAGQRLPLIAAANFSNLAIGDATGVQIDLTIPVAGKAIVSVSLPNAAFWTPAQLQSVIRRLQWSSMATPSDGERRASIELWGGANDIAPLEKAARSVLVVDGQAPSITSSTVWETPENRLRIGELAASEEVTWSVVSSNANLFQVNQNTLSWATLPDYESSSAIMVGRRYNVELSATDKVGNTTKQNITVSLTNVDEVPKAKPLVTNLSEDIPYSFKAMDFGFEDPDGDALETLLIESLPNRGQLWFQGQRVERLPMAISAANIPNLQYQPQLDETGTVTFSYRVRSAGSLAPDERLSERQTLSMSVQAVNDAPVWINPVTHPATLWVWRDAQNAHAKSLGLNEREYGPGGGADENLQTLSMLVESIPDSLLLFKADGTPVVKDAILTASEFAGLTFKTVAGRTGSGDLVWRVTDSAGAVLKLQRLTIEVRTPVALDLNGAAQAVTCV